MSTVLTITLNPTVDLFAETDVVRPVRKIRTSNDRCDPGGGGINVARVITEMGGDAEALFLCGGPTGTWLNALLEKAGIRRHMLPISGDTRVAYAVHERGSGFDYRFVPAGPSVSAQEIEPCMEIIRSRNARYVVASGSLPAAAPPDTYARMARIVAEQGGRFVLDTSGDGLRVTLEQARVFLVKPSIGELGQFVGHELDEQAAREAAMNLVRRGAAEMVAVTMGAQGALLATAEGVMKMPAPRVKARSAIGAGDSFLGAMVWALAKDWVVKGAFHLGIAAGAAAVLTPGTQLCRHEDIRSLYPMSPNANTEREGGID
ncbi:1-phosphofructokinase family hexose kinase [Chelativorans sp. AA-79]|uniref:1-phosphofructokinase family hexose kinase n=1 Tax=Chelativorans sp. AA-79 TaxID=3028735 RepID=UPI0023F62077|nr:1-phosphofructokinase family hexose kinase [Chelativorans sp. AA-79]WEX10734.1 1-phosphofructokinase family hexose kinase [Chelativorans sp. AA-79]